jgi:16S rRNA (guanine527-N7)-methyltransferase
MLDAKTLERELIVKGLSVSRTNQEKLGVYVRELERWNRTLNLTALEGAELLRRLVVEPAWIGQQLQVSGKLADIGSGNGSPGIPLYVTCSLEKAHLVEARARRAAFLRHVAHELDPPGILVHKIRVEDIEELEGVDWITLQAVSPSASLLETLRRLFRPTTRVVWITAAREAPVTGAARVPVPGSNTEAWVFQLDQF